MIRAGKIPNPLIAAAQKLYEGLNKSRANATFEETAKVMRLVVEEALAEPTMAFFRRPRSESSVLPAPT